MKLIENNQYNATKIEQYKKLKKTLMGEKFRDIIHPVLLKIMKTTRNFSLNVMNPLPDVSSQAIYCVNHSNKHDAPTVSEIIKKHHYLLVGKQNLNLVDQIIFNLNGVIYVDRKDKSSRSVAKQDIIEKINSGNNIVMFPEGTWNLSENKIMLPMNWGIIDISQKTNVPIIPIIMEYHDDICYVNCGQAIYTNQYSKNDAYELLVESMATLRWEIWEKFSVNKRANVSKEQFDNDNLNRQKEYPKLDSNYEASVIRKDYITAEEVFEPIRNICSKK